ncbi:MAG: hypothetical protein Q4P78_05910 [Rothia sp. (in: high G+C Gram-positive bacteria)]|uniref:hypothetical protein n=1 Tax=Rothia sp. (in: high G+C Gram-positive bacteria) TaxID=1885016 RepID=UPI0026E03BE8|nr:hypothetical protein [Rothia sp. (in: high G+C Gram-positive bacteria)]MDO5750724.1 hypothetical protein [Rothia sp. (in: high G+C Gram-positive bacteria)]
MLHIDPSVVDRVSPWAAAADRARAVGSGAVAVARPVVVQGVRGAAAGAVVNVPAYLVSYALTPEEVRVWDWNAFVGSEVTAAVGNGLGGYGSGVARFVTRRGEPGVLRWRVANGVVEYSWAVGAGYAGLFAGAGVSGSGVSWGTVVYYGGFNIANNYIASKLNFRSPYVQKVPGLRRVSPVYLEPLATAGLAGGSDIVKTYADFNIYPLVISYLHTNFSTGDL